MSDAIINSILVLVAALSGYGLSTYLEIRRTNKLWEIEAWKHRQQRIDHQLERRQKAYSEGLQYIYEIESNMSEAEKLFAVLARWKVWIPRNLIHLPPSVTEAVFSSIGSITLVYINKSNKQYDSENWKLFRKDMEKLKSLLLNQTDIAWLPEDLR